MEFSDAMSFGVRTVVKVRPAPRPPTGRWQTPWSHRTAVCPSGERREAMAKEGMLGGQRGVPTHGQQEKKRGQCNHGGRDWRDVATSQALPAATRNRNRQRRDSPPEPPEEYSPADTLVLAQESRFGLLASRTVRK
eukprot:NP_001276985.1 uncharacterized protein LOC101927572 isoform 1 [Homo sapiens]